MEFPAFMVMLIFFFIGISKTTAVTVIFILLWAAHYFHRTFIYSFIMKGGGKKFPLILVAFAFIFNSINGYLNGRYLFHFAPAGKYNASWLHDPRFITGVIIFIAGMSINIYSDHILRGLRKNGQAGYLIPQGGLFKYVSCPNYFGEILEWTGWAIATWSLPGLAFAVFTSANLMPRAFSNHRWYLEYFPDYPGDRKALIPFLI